MATVNNWLQLVDEVNKLAAIIAIEDVAPTVKELYKKHIDDEVYKKYQPQKYNRRNELSNEKNIIGEMNGNILEIRNISTPNKSISHPPTPYRPQYDTQFAGWVENGEVYNGKSKYLFPKESSNDAWTKPRPFTINTIDDLKRNKQHLTALKEGMKRRGFKVK